MNPHKFDPFHAHTHPDAVHRQRKMMLPNIVPGPAPLPPHTVDDVRMGNQSGAAFPGIGNSSFQGTEINPGVNPYYAPKPSYAQGAPYPPGTAIKNGQQPDMMHYLTNCLELQQKQMQELQKQLLHLTKRVQEAESKPVYKIEKLEYHFDQLKVEKLDGTLNIGMTPPATEQLDELGQVLLPQNKVQGGASVYPINPATTANAAANNEAPPIPIHMQSPGALKQMMQRVDDYMNESASEVLNKICQELECSIDMHHRSMVLADIHKQLPSRLQHYLQHHGQSFGASANSSQPQQRNLEEHAVNCTIRDAELAMRQYLTNIASLGKSQLMGYVHGYVHKEEHQMDMKVVNHSLQVGCIELIGVASASLLQVGDTDKITLYSFFDTPPESLIVGPLAELPPPSAATPAPLARLLVRPRNSSSWV